MGVDGSVVPSGKNEDATLLKQIRRHFMLRGGALFIEKALSYIFASTVRVPDF